MDDRPQDRREWLRREVAGWVRDGLISPQQGEAILAHRPADEPLAARSRTTKRVAVIFGVLGALLVGLGVILLFATNWQAIPRWIKFGVILLATGGAYALGYWLRYARGYSAVGSALILLGGLLYGAGIFLVGQMFHVQAEPHYGLLLWAVGVLPLAYAIPSPPLVTLAAVLLAVWVGAVSIFGLEHYGIDDQILVFRNLLAAGIILYGLGRLHGRVRGVGPLGRAPLVTGGLIVLLTYLLFTTPWTAGWAPPRDPALPVAIAALLYGLLGGAAATLLGLIALAPDRRRSIAELAGLGILLAWIWVMPWVAPVLRRTVGGGSDLAWLFVLGENLLLFGICLGAVALGVARNDRALVNLGLVFFALGVAMRYIDLIGRMVTTSLFFIGGGVLLLGGGWLIERTRRRLLARMEARADGA